MDSSVWRQCGAVRGVGNSSAVGIAHDTPNDNNHQATAKQPRASEEYLCDHNVRTCVLQHKTKTPPSHFSHTVLLFRFFLVFQTSISTFDILLFIYEVFLLEFDFASTAYLLKFVCLAESSIYLRKLSSSKMKNTV